MMWQQVVHKAERLRRTRGRRSYCSAPRGTTFSRISLRTMYMSPFSFSQGSIKDEKPNNAAKSRFVIDDKCYLFSFLESLKWWASVKWKQFIAGAPLSMVLKVQTHHPFFERFVKNSRHASSHFLQSESDSDQFTCKLNPQKSLHLVAFTLISMTVSGD